MGANTAEPAMHDAVMRVLGFTLVHADLTDGFDVATTDARDSTGKAEERMLRGLLARLEVWLRAERRVVEVVSGRALERAFLVRIDEHQRVTEVLLAAEDHQRVEARAGSELATRSARSPARQRRV